jgi:hypothetical protein
MVGIFLAILESPLQGVFEKMVGIFLAILESPLHGVFWRKWVGFFWPG